MKRYFLNIPDAPSPMMEFGKQFASDIEDYCKGEKREFNFPNNFLNDILIYPHVEHKLEYDFGDFKFIGYIDNASENFEIIRDFKTGTAAWTQDRLENSLQMQAYSYVIFQQYTKKFNDKILSYSTYEKKSYTHSPELQEREEQLAAQKKQEILYGVATEETKTITLLTVKDAK
jgi:hypothetical protein